jgi:hypothetical protein
MNWIYAFLFLQSIFMINMMVLFCFSYSRDVEKIDRESCTRLASFASCTNLPNPPI